MDAPGRWAEPGCGAPIPPRTPTRRPPAAAARPGGCEPARAARVRATVSIQADPTADAAGCGGPGRRGPGCRAVSSGSPSSPPARPSAEESRARLVARYGDVPVAEAQAVVALGGDGHLLETMHAMTGQPTPIYGMNCGSVGFMMNPFSEDDLPRPPRRGAGRRAAPAADARRDADRRGGGGGGAERGQPAAAVAPGGEDPDLGRWPGAHRGIDLRRRAGVDARRVDGLQPVGAWPDRAALGQPAAVDPDQRVPPAALARRPAAEHGGRAVRGAGAGEAAGGGGGRRLRGAQRGLGRGERGPYMAWTVLFDPDMALSERIITEQFTV